eukprot:1258050-Amorphochlora_amoeboformis.AAC.3
MHSLQERVCTIRSRESSPAQTKFPNQEPIGSGFLVGRKQDDPRYWSATGPDTKPSGKQPSVA